MNLMRKAKAQKFLHRSTGAAEVMMGGKRYVLGGEPCCLSLFFVLAPWDLKVASKGGWEQKAVPGDMEMCR